MKNDIILITGGSSGYGKAAAKKFYEAGAKVIICARNKEQLEKTRQEIGDIDIVPMDVTSVEDWKRVQKYVEETYGHIDCLINNAGGGVAIVDLEHQTYEDIDKCIALNLNSAIYGSKVFTPMFKAQKEGTIINVSSVCAKHAWVGWTPYTAAKVGVLGLSKGLHVELRPYNVRVTCIIPAAGNTNFRKNANTPDMPVKLEAEDIAQAMYDVYTMPKHIVVEEMTVWGIDQDVDPF